MIKYIVIILAVLFALVFLDEYRVANLPDDLKKQYYAERQEKQLIASKEAAEREAEREEVLNSQYSEVPDEEKGTWIIANVFPYILSFAMMLVALGAVINFIGRMRRGH